MQHDCNRRSRRRKMDLEQTIRDAASEFAQTVVRILRNMTLDELAGIVRSPVAASTAGAPVRKQRAATKATSKPVAASAASRKLSMTPARKAALKIQGQYIGLVRTRPAAVKAKMKKLAAAKGMAAAVEAMKRGKK
jgi:hypothetical protein